jgi:hypothetical protein
VEKNKKRGDGKGGIPTAVKESNQPKRGYTKNEKGVIKTPLLPARRNFVKEGF